MQLEQLLWTLVITITTGLIVSIATVCVTVYLALRSFRAERLWDRRVDAYQTVLVALHTWSRDCIAEWANYTLQSEQKQNEDERRKFREADAEIYKAIDLGSFLLSDEAANCLKKLEKRMQESILKHKEDYFGYLTDTQVDVRDCLEKMRDIAKKDIKKLQI